MIRRYLILSFVALACLGLTATQANACTCGPKPSVLDAWETANYVVSVKTRAIDRTPLVNNSDRILAVRMTVIKSFKGDLKPGDEMIFLYDRASSCTWDFDDQAYEQEYLLYLAAPPGKSRHWSVNICGRSKFLKDAADDLLYLNNEAALRGKTRLSGTIDFGADPSAPRTGIKLRVTNGKQTYLTAPNADGVYELYDFPAGKYTVEPELPLGWRLEDRYLGMQNAVERGTRNISWRKIPIVIEAKKHATLDLKLEIENRVTGKVTDANGVPLAGVRVFLTPADEIDKITGQFRRTESDGSFDFSEVPSGRYYLVANEAGKINAFEPFPAVYYPGSLDRNKGAVVFYVAPGQSLFNLAITVPQLAETVTVRGMLLHSDGKPAAGELIRFTADRAEDGVDGNSSATTDAEGRFSIKVLKGITGLVYGHVFIIAEKHLNCPALEKVFTERGSRTAEIDSDKTQVVAHQDRDGLILKLPFPFCQKVK